LRSYALLPSIISLIVIVGGLIFGLGYVTTFSDYLLSSLPGWLSFLEWVLVPLLYVMGLLVGAWSFGLLATVIGSPFLGELSGKVEGLAPQSSNWWQQLGVSLARELRKLRYHLPRLLILILLTFVPILNAVAPLLWLGFGAWMMAAQFCDYSSENNQRSFEDTLTCLGQHRGAALGFGACVTVAMSIPIVNILVPPAAAAGGTLLIQSLRGQ